MRGDPPHPSENPHWPSWFYPPETAPEDPAAHGRIFEKAEDVPEGWLVDYRMHGTNLAREPRPAEEIPFTRQELKDELVKRDISFQSTAAKAELWRLLEEAVEAERLEAQV